MTTMSCLFDLLGFVIVFSFYPFALPQMHLFLTFQEDMIPVGEANNFKFTVEHHFGGGGAYQLSRDWSTYTVNPLASTGAAIGLKFSNDT